MTWIVEFMIDSKIKKKSCQNISKKIYYFITKKIHPKIEHYKKLVILFKYDLAFKHQSKERSFEQNKAGCVPSVEKKHFFIIFFIYFFTMSYRKMNVFRIKVIFFDSGEQKFAWIFAVNNLSNLDLKCFFHFFYWSFFYWAMIVRIPLLISLTN